MLKVSVKGFNQAKTILDQLPKEMRSKLIQSALRNSSNPMLRSAKNRVPVDWGILQEKIRSTYVTKRQLGSAEAAIAIAPVFGRTRSGKINAYYGRFVHQGTKRGVKANPFLLNAFQETETQTISLFGEELGRSVQRFVRRKFKSI
ncbi:MAG: HK97-gp10 family putative phage morphogenesis protein [Rikenellaceae bacterium]